jgi:transposase
MGSVFKSSASRGEVLLNVALMNAELGEEEHNIFRLMNELDTGGFIRTERHPAGTQFIRCFFPQPAWLLHTRARILHLLDRKVPPPEIAQTLSCGIATVYNVKRRYLTEGLEAALSDKARSGRPPRIDGRARAKITALACTQAPEGHARSTLRLLADKAIKLGCCESISHNAVKEILKKTDSSRT